MMKRISTALAALAATLLLPAIASAMPTDQTIHGRIVAVTGKYSLQLRDDNGYVDNVQLHQGTVIDPTGASLEPGMQATITGHGDGNGFVADDVDEPNVAPPPSPSHYQSPNIDWQNFLPYY